MQTIDVQFLKAVEFLEKNGLVKSRSELSEKLGYKQSTFTEILKGRTKVNTNILQNFCKMYNINLYWLFYGEGEIFMNESPPSKEPVKELTLEDRIKNIEIQLQNLQNANT